MKQKWVSEIKLYTSSLNVMYRTYLGPSLLQSQYEKPLKSRPYRRIDMRVLFIII